MGNIRRAAFAASVRMPKGSDGGGSPPRIARPANPATPRMPASLCVDGDLRITVARGAQHAAAARPDGAASP